MNFCSAQADARGDSMLATAPPQSRVLLVHQPGPWGPRGLAESRCDPVVAERIARAAGRRGMRLQTIRRPGKHERDTPQGGYDVAIADTVAGTTTWWKTDDLAAIVPELEGERPHRAPHAVETTPIYLVCTHGRHDACCALRGIPLVKALHELRPGRVWETTHVSGDRFAANVLVLPGGELYGRVTPADAQSFAQAIDAGKVIPHALRGRIGLAPFAQAALVYAHERLGVAARAELSVTAMRPIDADRAHVDVRTPSGVRVVTVEAHTTAPAQRTCHGPDDVPSREYRGIALGEPEAATSLS